MSQKLNLKFKRYSVFPLLLVILFNIFAFNVTRLLTAGKTHYDLSLPIDKALPFLPIFIFPYVIAYIQWFLNYYLIGCQERDFMMKYISAALTAKLITAVIFIAVPTSMVRPELQVHDFTTWFTNFIFTVDSPDNLFPSIHVIAGWFSLRMSFKVSGLGKYRTPYIVWNIVMFLLILPTILLIKQHLFLDILGGIAVSELGMLLSTRLHFEKILNKITPIHNNSQENLN